MTDEAPRSLRDDPESSPLLLSMLDDARAQEGLDEAALARAVARVDALGPMPVASSTTWPLLTKVGLAITLLAVLGSGAAWVVARTPRETPPVTTAPSVPLVDAPPEPMPLPPEAPEVAAPTLPEAVPAEHAPPPSEGALLLAARVALRSANPTRALALTAQHERLFPRGAMREERDVIAIEALTQTGDRTRAARRAGAFLQRYPSSPYRARVEGLLAAPQK